MPSATSPDAARRRRSGCPGCGATPMEPFAPFCGRGCRDRDLLAWFGEERRIPGRAEVVDDGED